MIKEHETRESDIQWNRIVKLEIVPHPSLKHPKTIETDYAMENLVIAPVYRSPDQRRLEAEME